MVGQTGRFLDQIELLRGHFAPEYLRNGRRRPVLLRAKLRFPVRVGRQRIVVGKPRCPLMTLSIANVAWSASKVTGPLAGAAGPVSRYPSSGKRTCSTRGAAGGYGAPEGNRCTQRHVPTALSPRLHGFDADGVDYSVAVDV